MKHQDEVLDSDIKGITDNTPHLHVKYAGFWIRVAASFIDAIVLIPIMGIAFYNTVGLKNVFLALILILAAAIYKPFMEYKYGATLGKIAVKVKVVSLEYMPIELRTAIIRYMPWILVHLVTVVTTYLMYSDPAFLDAGTFMEFTLFNQEKGYDMYTNIANLAVFISALAVVFDKEKQGLHDRLADTYCIYAK